jgi:hypothetical protein
MRTVSWLPRDQVVSVGISSAVASGMVVGYLLLAFATGTASISSKKNDTERSSKSVALNKRLALTRFSPRKFGRYRFWQTVFAKSSVKDRR